MSFSFKRLGCAILTAHSSLYTGRAGDWLVLKLTRARGGIFESEYRLWLFGISCLLVPFGLILWGVGAAHGVQWFGLVFAMGVIGFTNSLGVQISISYCIESYRELSSEAIVTVILIRNTMSFAIGYGFATLLNLTKTALTGSIESHPGSPIWVFKTLLSLRRLQVQRRSLHFSSSSSMVGQ